MEKILTPERRSALTGMIQDWLRKNVEHTPSFDYMDDALISGLIEEAISPTISDAVVCATAALAHSDAVQAQPTDKASETERYFIEGTVFFMRSDAATQACICCPPGGGHIFGRGVEWDAWQTNRPKHFGNGPDVLMNTVTDRNGNEGKRVRVTIEVLSDAAPVAPAAAAQKDTWELIREINGGGAAAIAPSPTVAADAEAPSDTRFTHPGCDVCACPSGVCQADAAPQAIEGYDLKTSTGGRGYLVEYFATRLRRHDFQRFIEERLAADFACVLAKHLRDLDAVRIADAVVNPDAESQCKPRCTTLARNVKIAP